MTDPLLAGHVQPSHATNPGLVYNLTIDDHLNFLCVIGYSQTWIQLFASKTDKCPENSGVHNFNYPSVAVHTLEGKVIVTRRLKNVGNPGIYYALLRNLKVF
ncbi:hypothetical protein M9H77_17531 [Catharanthus roseus]|uniref:Uncharacterized protein n=1 Tax=Catharanthus roseus TaxID=4058 RepID=A0ACC0B4X5_CATRO|nr:hypothetical protein M9H77_17531 [Catharanthus roseus]